MRSSSQHSFGRSVYLLCFVLSFFPKKPLNSSTFHLAVGLASPRTPFYMSFAITLASTHFSPKTYIVGYDVNGMPITNLATIRKQSFMPVENGGAVMSVKRKIA